MNKLLLIILLVLQYEKTLQGTELSFNIGDLSLINKRSSDPGNPCIKFLNESIFSASLSQFFTYPPFLSEREKIDKDILLILSKLFEDLATKTDLEDQEFFLKNENDLDVLSRKLREKIELKQLKEVISGFNKIKNSAIIAKKKQAKKKKKKKKNETTEEEENLEMVLQFLKVIENEVNNSIQYIGPIFAEYAHILKTIGGDDLAKNKALSFFMLNIVYGFLNEDVEINKSTEKNNYRCEFVPVVGKYLGMMLQEKTIDNNSGPELAAVKQLTAFKKTLMYVPVLRKGFLDSFKSQTETLAWLERDFGITDARAILIYQAGRNALVAQPPYDEFSSPHY